MAQHAPDQIARRKDDLRRVGRLRRRSLAAGSHQQLDHRIGRHLVRQVEALAARCVAAYVAFDGEPDLGPVLPELQRIGVRLALPALENGGGGAMRMRAWQAGAPMRANRYGIPEPAEGPEVPLGGIDIILLPLVAYDATGTRLGMGSAYYDRFLHDLAAAERPLRAGVAYAVQELEHIPRQPWDVPLHAVVNEKGWVFFGGPDRENVRHTP